MAVVGRLERENRTLRKLHESLSLPWNPGFSPFLNAHFESRLSRLKARLNTYYCSLMELDREVRSTRVIDGGSLDDKCEKTRLLGLNDRLIDRVLFQEQQILVDKLRLRLLHDHRDICVAREQLELVRQGRDPPAPDTRQKERIRNLKGAIEHERWRIALLRSGHAELHIAAAVIQKTWRGYSYRRRNPTLSEPPAREAPPPVQAVPPIPIDGRAAPVPHMDKVDSSDEYYSYADSGSAPEDGSAGSGTPDAASAREEEEEELGEAEGEDEEELLEAEEEAPEEDERQVEEDSLFEVTGVADAEEADSDAELDRTADGGPGEE
jgi:hypothetical protein